MGALGSSAPSAAAGGPSPGRTAAWTSTRGTATIGTALGWTTAPSRTPGSAGVAGLVGLEVLQVLPDHPMVRGHLEDPPLLA